MLGEHCLNLLHWLPRMCGIYLPDVSYDYILMLGMSPILVLGANLEEDRKTLAEFLSPGFWVAVPLFRNREWAMCALYSWACSEISKEG